jgi:hypothetical protein
MRRQKTRDDPTSQVRSAVPLLDRPRTEPPANDTAPFILYPCPLSLEDFPHRDHTPADPSTEIKPKPLAFASLSTLLKEKAKNPPPPTNSFPFPFPFPWGIPHPARIREACMIRSLRREAEEALRSFPVRSKRFRGGLFSRWVCPRTARAQDDARGPGSEGGNGCGGDGALQAGRGERERERERKRKRKREAPGGSAGRGRRGSACMRSRHTGL